MLCMEVVQPDLVVRHIPHVPAVVKVVAPDIGQLHQGAVGLQQEKVGHGGYEAGIHGMDQVVKDPVVLQKVLCHSV